ncbi:MAG TPA: matrixin family metalloprotease, partial [Planctomycetota bacterium]|nr:matrixin family metalloprotease [Planctomycetota bacterium]
CPGVTDGSAEAAIRIAFQKWESVPSTTIRFQEDQNPNDRASTEWNNNPNHMVWFDTSDSSGMFSNNSGLVAVTPVNFAGDGSILGASIIFNAKDHQFSTTLQPGTFDVQSIATHECGHFQGLDHSPIVGATMYPFANQQDVHLRQLQQDDVAGCSTIYPRSGFGGGSISGKLVDGHGNGISGAHVVAEDAQGQPASSCLSASDGSFQVLGLVQGAYTVYIEPLDGPVQSQNLSVGTSNLKINTNFGTTFIGGNASAPQPINVSTGTDTILGNITLRPSVGLTIQGSNPTTVLAGDTVTFNIWGSGFQSGDTVFVTGDGFTVQSTQVLPTSIGLTVKLDPGMPPTLRTIRLVRTSTGDSRCLSGGVEVRLPAPALSGISPASATPGTAITLRGVNLNSQGIVVVGDQIVQSPSATGSNVVFPCPNIQNGVFDVTFQNADGQMAVITQGLTVTGSTATNQETPPAGGSSGSSGNTGGSSGGGGQQTQATQSPSGQVTGFVSGGGGGGGGHGGCDVAPAGGSPVSVLPLLAALALLARRRRAARG